MRFGDKKEITRSVCPIKNSTKLPIMIQYSLNAMVQLGGINMEDKRYYEEWDELQEKLVILIEKRIVGSLIDINNIKVNAKNLYFAIFMSGKEPAEYLRDLIITEGNCYTYLNLDKSDSELYLNELVSKDIEMLLKYKDILYKIIIKNIELNKSDYEKKIDSFTEFDNKLELSKEIKGK